MRGHASLSPGAQREEGAWRGGPARTRAPEQGLARWAANNSTRVARGGTPQHQGHAWRAQGATPGGGRGGGHRTFHQNAV